VSECEFIAHKDLHADDALMQSFNWLESADASLPSGGASVPLCRA